MSNKCNHNWYTVSWNYHDVDGCLGVICIKCGELSCACNKDYKDRNDIGDEAYKKFHLKDKINLMEG